MVIPFDFTVPGEGGFSELLLRPKPGTKIARLHTFWIRVKIKGNSLFYLNL
jgi:hypothetical protein